MTRYDAPVVMDEVPVHPFACWRPARADGRVDGGADLPDAPAMTADRLGGRRRIEDGQRQQAEIDADGGEQRDQVAAGDRLAAVGVRPSGLPPDDT